MFQKNPILYYQSYIFYHWEKWGVHQKTCHLSWSSVEWHTICDFPVASMRQICICSEFGDEHSDFRSKKCAANSAPPCLFFNNGQGAWKKNWHYWLSSVQQLISWAHLLWTIWNDTCAFPPFSLQFGCSINDTDFQYIQWLSVHGTFSTFSDFQYMEPAEKWMQKRVE